MSSIETESPIRLEFGWSDPQAAALCIVAVISSCLSIFGSLRIAYQIVTTPGLLSSLKDRFLLAICVSDIILSTDFLLGQFLIPSETNIIWAFGNRSTCSVIAFFFFFAIAVCWNNASLALYFYWKVCRGWSDEYIAKYYERPLYAWAFGLSIVMSGVVMAHRGGNHFPLARSCNLFVYPTDCPYVEGVECEAKANFWVLFSIVSICQFTGFATAFIATLRVFLAVRKSTRQAAAAGSDAALRRQQRVQRQAVLYFCSYFNSFIWFTLLGIMVSFFNMSDTGDPGVYTIIFLSHMIYPLMGFLNMFIYQSGRKPDARRSSRISFQSPSTTCSRRQTKSSSELRTSQMIPEMAAFTKSQKSTTDSSLNDGAEVK